MIGFNTYIRIKTSHLVRQKIKMSDSWTLKEIISSQYNRGGTTRCTNRSVLFLIENQRTTEVSLFYINRVNKMSVSLSCNQRSCNHRLSMQHFMPTKQYGKNRIYAEKMNANTSESTLKSIPADFYFLNDIFVWLSTV